MKFSSLVALFIASRIGPSEQQQQARIRRKLASPTLPQNSTVEKPEVCYRPSGTAFSANVNADGYYVPDVEQNSVASLEFGIMQVDDGDSLLVDVMVQSMMLSVLGNFNDDDGHYTNTFGEVVANAFLHKGCSALPCTNTTESVFPGGLIMAYAGSNGSMLVGGDGSRDELGNGLEFKSTNNGKFFFPGLEEGSYLLEVEFDLTAAIEVEEEGEFGQDVEINEHLVKVTRTANEGECDWTSTSKTATKEPKSFKGGRRHLLADPSPPPSPLSTQKPEVCYRPSGTAFTAYANANYYYDGEQNSAASLDFGILQVEDGESLLVDVMVQSVILSVMVGRNDDDIYTDSYGEVVANVFLHRSCSALPCNNQYTSVFPGGLVMAYSGSNGSTLKGGDDDEENIFNGLEFISANNGKFFFPGLEEGSYLLRVEFDLTAAIKVREEGQYEQDVDINEHIVTVTRSAKNEGECDWTSTSKTSTKAPRDFKGSRHL